MRIIFIGTVELSLHMLKNLIEEEQEIVGVITSSDTGINSDYTDLGPISKKNKIPVVHTNNVNSQEMFHWMCELSPDVIFCIGWSRLVNKKILEIPSIGVIGYHPAALPQNRGRHPLIWALVLGLERTASTFFFMDEGVDSGDILDQRTIPITHDDNASTLYKKMIKIATEQIQNILPALINGTYMRASQYQSESNIWRKRGEKDGVIDWRMSAKAIHNLIRGLSKPYLGAHFVIDGKEYKVWKSRVISCINSENIEPGKVVFIGQDKIPCIRCGDDCIELIDIEPELLISKGDYL